MFVATYTVPPGAPLPDNHVLVPPELLSFPADSLYATPLEEEDEDDVEDFSEDVIIVDPRDQIEYNTQKPRGPKELTLNILLKLFDKIERLEHKIALKLSLS